ncbi:MAG: hypothetical protein WCV82_04085 [Candidatus Paceibacterota bacterium]
MSTVPTEVSDVMDRIADIVRRVGKREEIEERVAENVDFAALINELLKQEGPVREAATKAVAKMMANLEIEQGSDTETNALEGIDFKAFAAGLANDPEIQEAIKDLIKGVVENVDTSDSSWNEVIDEAFGLNNAEKLAKLLGESEQGELNTLVVSKVREMIDNWDPDDLEASTKVEIEKEVFNKDRVGACLAALNDEINQGIGGFVSKVIEASDPEDADDVLAQLVLESDTLKAAVNTAVENLNRSGRIDRFVEEAVTSMLSGEDSSVRAKIEAAVSAKLTELVGGMTESIVNRLFEKRP